MAITNGYCTLAEARAHLGITDAADTTDDTVIESRVEVASRAIEQLTGRRFYRNGTDETRTYTSRETDVFECPDDIGSITTLKTDEDGDRVYETLWTTDDYDTEPYNASLDGLPFARLRVTPAGTYAFPTVRRGVQIVGKFGYAATTPQPVKAACLILLTRIFRRKDTPYGTAGPSSIGLVTLIGESDPDVQALLMPFLRGIAGSGI